MNRLAIITAFLGTVRNRYLTYAHERSLDEKVRLAAQIPGVEGLELCYPADFSDVGRLRRLLDETGLKAAAVNVRSRRDGKWQRGSLSSQVAEERNEAVEDFYRAVDYAAEIGADRITTCPLNEGHDYVFEMNYIDAYRFMEESLSKICGHNRAVRVCIEYKQSDPRSRCLVASAGETIALCDDVGAPNLGATLDFGHSLLAGERPAQALVLLHRAKRLFYVHINDNDRNWDWDQVPGAYHINELVEFFYYLQKVGYTDDWYAFDILVKEISTERQMEVGMKLTRLVEKLARRIDVAKMDALLAKRDPSRSTEYFFQAVFNTDKELS